MEQYLPYCQNPYLYSRRKTRPVRIGNIGIGGDHPIRVQSMTITDTRDTQATVTQIKQLAEVGCEIVRVTVPSIAEAENLKNIKASLRGQGINVPLVADIHFTPNAALKAVEFVEKVRINPGNFADRRRFEQRDYTEGEYQQELERIENQFKPLVLKAKTYGIALRIGTNHGSLSDRIMNRFGDTPEGMVESALEFVRICERHGFNDIVLSMKSSNPLVMIQAYRLLAARMAQEKMDYPFHLGVTEAGDGEDGRVKSAVGIGSLLADGIGDTIRVSLTEDPVEEVPVGFQLVQKYNELLRKNKISTDGDSFSHRLLSSYPDFRNPYAYQRRSSREVSVGGIPIGSGHPIRIELSVQKDFSCPKDLLKEVIHLTNPWDSEGLRADLIEIPIRGEKDVDPFIHLKRELDFRRVYPSLSVRISSEVISLERVFKEADKVNVLPIRGQPPEASRRFVQETIRLAKSQKIPIQWEVGEDSLPRSHPSAEGTRLLEWVKTCEDLARGCIQENFESFLFSIQWDEVIGANRLLAARLKEMKQEIPLVVRATGPNDDGLFLLGPSVVLGSLLSDGIGDVIRIDAQRNNTDILRLCYNILQAARLRITKTDFISCPSCGRTLFDLQTTTERIKSKMSHLKGLKIAIMGCIVNGPGEMADADFGYVGSGHKKVDLYVGKDRVQKNVPEEAADDRLIELIKSQGKWVDP